MKKISLCDLKNVCGAGIVKRCFVEYGGEFIPVEDFVYLCICDGFTAAAANVFVEMRQRKYFYDVFSDDDVNGLGNSKLIACRIRKHEDAVCIDNMYNSKGFINSTY